MNAPALPFIALSIGLAVGRAIAWCVTWLYSKMRTAKLEAERAADVERIEWIKSSQVNLRETFEALSSKSLRANSDEFSGRIDTRLNAHAGQIGTLKDSLEKNVTQLDQYVRLLEQKREGAYESLKEQVKQLKDGHTALLQTTQHLVAALKSGPVRGRWGEIQLRKIVELAGMTEHVSFIEQAVGTDGGKPDTLVHLPNEGRIPIDSKFPLDAFLEAMEALNEETRKCKFAEHVKALKDKIKDLSKKGYWKEFDPSPELTIMFIPIESCLMVAYEHDPSIIEFALEHKIILASPVTLLGFMKSIAYGWQQFTISKNARKILASGKELYGRLGTWIEHYKDTGEKIESAARSYNKSIASLQSRFFPACRKFQELTAIAEEIVDAEPIELAVNLPAQLDRAELSPLNGTSGPGE